MTRAPFHPALHKPDMLTFRRQRPKAICLTHATLLKYLYNGIDCQGSGRDLCDALQGI